MKFFSETGLNYRNYNEAIIKSLIYDCKQLLVGLERELTYKQNENLSEDFAEFENEEVLNDFSEDEYLNGLNFAKDFLKDEKDLNAYLELLSHKLSKENKLKALKVIKKDKINQAKENELKSGVVFKENTFNLNVNDFILLNSYFSNYESEITWISLENNIVTLNDAEIKELIKLMNKRKNEIVLKYRLLKDELEKLTTLKALKEFEI